MTHAHRSNGYAGAPGSAQPTLFDLAPTVPVTGNYETLDDRFWAFHEQNPHVYRALVQLARQLKAAGRRRFGIGALFERLRFEAALRTWGDEFRLNNNYRSRYARLIMRQEPDLDGFFELRELQTRSALDMDASRPSHKSHESREGSIA